MKNTVINSTVRFEHDKFFNKINMKILKEDQIVFYKDVTEDVINIARECEEYTEKNCNDQNVIRSIQSKYFD